MLQKGSCGAEVQDDDRQEAMRGRLRLSATGRRIGVDAYDELGFAYELKTTTKGTVSTGRDLHAEKVSRWRQQFWVVGRGRYIKTDDQPGKGLFHFSDLYFLAPIHLEVYYSKWEAHWAECWALWREVDERLVGMTPEQCLRNRAIYEQGMRLNDPSIPLSHIRKHGIRLEGDVAVHLRQLRDQFRHTVPDPGQEGVCAPVIMTG